MKKILGLLVAVCFVETLFFTGCGSTENVVVEKKEKIAVPTPPEGYIMFEESRFNTNESMVRFYKDNASYISPDSFLAWTGYEWIAMEKINYRGYSSKDEKYKTGNKICSKNGFLAREFRYIDEAKSNIEFIIAFKIEDIIPNTFSKDEDSELFEAINSNFWDWFTGSYNNIIYPNEKLYTYQKTKEKIKAAKYKNDTYAYNLTRNGTISIYGYLGSSIENLVIPETIEGLAVTEIYNMGLPLRNVIIKSVTIPKTVKRIGENAFSNMGLKFVNFPDQSITIDKRAFCNNEIEVLNLPRKTVYLEADAFSNNKIKKLNIYKDWKYGGSDGGFTKNSEYLEEIFFEDGCTYIYNYAFQNCKGLKRISIPASIKVIEDCAFRGCTSLSDVEIRGNLTLNQGFFIGEYCFKECPIPLQPKAKLLKAGLPSNAFGD